MKNKIFLILGLSLLFFSCKDNGVSVINNNENALTLTGKILNKSNTRTDTLYALIHYDSLYYSFDHILSSTTISSDGLLSMNISVPPSRYLYNYLSSITKNYVDSVDISHLLINNAKVNSALIYLIIKNRINNSGIELGIIINGNSHSSKLLLTPDDFYTSIYYFDASALIQGYSISTSSQGNTYKTNYDLKVHKGWNFILKTLISKNRGVFEYKVSDVNSPKGNWYYQ